MLCFHPLKTQYSSLKTICYFSHWMIVIFVVLDCNPSTWFGSVRVGGVVSWRFKQSVSLQIFLCYLWTLSVTKGLGCCCQWLKHKRVEFSVPVFCVWVLLNEVVLLLWELIIAFKKLFHLKKYISTLKMNFQQILK